MDAPTNTSIRFRILLIAGLFALYTSWTVVLMYRVPATHDEATYIRAGRIVLKEGWGGERTFFHGPLPLLLTQIVPAPLQDAAPYQASIFRARLGSLCFGWLGFACCYVLARRAFGSRAGLLALVLYALNPLILGYGALATVDLAQAVGIAATLVALQSYYARPHLVHLLSVGAALGLSFSLKYLGLLFGPPVAFVVAIVAWRHSASQAQSRWRRLGALLFATTVFSVCALVSLHAACGFSSGFAAAIPELYRSTFLQNLAAQAPLNWLLRALPQSVVHGLDAYYWTWRDAPPIFLNQTFADSHPSYFLWSYLRKLPEWVWLLFVLGIAAARWRPLPQRMRCGGIFALVLLPPLTYLSLAHGTQLGIRYALALLIPLLVIAASAVNWVPAMSQRRFTVLLAALALLSGAESFHHHPNLLGYFARTSGGPARAYQYFDGSNCDWGQLRQAGLDELRATERRPFEVLVRGDGARFGRVAIYIEDRHAAHPDDPSRARHWLDVFEPIRNIGSAWWLYEITPAEFERVHAAAPDALLSADLATAALGSNLDQRARELLPALPDRLRERMANVLALRQRSSSAPFTPQVIWDLRHAWLELGRRDRARDVLSDPRLLSVEGCIRVEAERLLSAPLVARAFLDDIAVAQPEAMHDEACFLLWLHLISAEHYYARALELYAAHEAQLSSATREKLSSLIELWRQRAREVEASFAPR